MTVSVDVAPRGVAFPSSVSGGATVVPIFGNVKTSPSSAKKVEFSTADDASNGGIDEDTLKGLALLSAAGNTDAAKILALASNQGAQQQSNDFSFTVGGCANGVCANVGVGTQQPTAPAAPAAPAPDGGVIPPDGLLQKARKFFGEIGSAIGLSADQTIAVALILIVFLYAKSK